MTTLPLLSLALHRITVSASEDMLARLMIGTKTFASSLPHRRAKARKEFSITLWKELGALWACTDLEQPRVHWVALEAGSRSDDFSVEFIADTHHPIHDEMMQTRINQAILAAYEKFTGEKPPESYTIEITGTWWQKHWTATVADADEVVTDPELEPIPVS